MTFVRIRQPKNKSQDVPQSLTIDKVKIVQGGSGVEIKDAGAIGRAKKIIGAGNIETSKEPFKIEASRRGGAIDMSAKEMKYPAEDKGESETSPGTVDKAEPETTPEKDESESQAAKDKKTANKGK